VYAISSVFQAAVLHRFVLLIGVPVSAAFAQTVVQDPGTPAPQVATRGVTTAMTPHNSSSEPFFDMRTGVSVTFFSSPEFNALVSKAISNQVRPSVAGILPYSLFIHNNSGKSIVGYGIRWKTISPSGDPMTYNEVVFDRVDLKPVIPRSGYLFLSPLPLSTENVAKAAPLSAETVQQVQAKVEELQSQASVVASVEVILFSDGTSLGPDHGAVALMLKRMIQAELDLYKRVDQAGASGLPGILQDLPSEAGKKIQSRSYSHFQVQTGRELARVMNASGTDAVIAFVKSRLRTKPYSELLSNQ